MTLDSCDHQPAVLTDDQLRELTDRHAPILQQLSEGVIIAVADGRLMFVNEAAERLHGIKKLNVAPDEYSETYSLFTMDGQPYRYGELPLARAVARGERVEDARWRIRRPDGTEVIAIGSARPLMAEGRQIGAILNVRDDSERFEAERKLRESEERLSLVIDAATDYAIFTTDPDRIITSWSRGAELAFHFSSAEIIGQCADILWVPEDREMRQPEQEAATARSAGCANDQRWHQRKGGSRVFMNGSAHPLPPNPDGSERGFIKIAQDETERREIEDALRQRTSQFESLFSDSPLGIYLIDADFRIRQVNPVARKVFAGIPDIIGRDFEQTVRALWAEDFADELMRLFRHTLATGEPYFSTEEIEQRLDRGLTEYYEWQINRIGLPEGGYGIACYFRDISARVRARHAIAESEARFRNMADHAPVMMWVTEPDGRCTYLNRAWYEFTGQSEEEALGFGWLKAVHPADEPEAERAFVESIANAAPFRVEYRLRRADGAHRWAIDAAAPRFGAEGQFLGFVGSVIDINERREAEDVLANLNETLERRVMEEVARRSEAEEALRQSQKMETLGQLTGGIAHDFNNLLQIITGNLDILRRTIPTDSPRLRRSVENAFRGAERAAILTQRLLAFARRQPLVPKVFNPNRLVMGMTELLHRAIGETVAIGTVLGSRLWQVEADSNQLEIALLNLAINARDAMPGGGKLTIETANTHLDRSYAEKNSGVATGQYVVICVTDSGTGMDAATVERAFDPFFTTKDVGKGTGLGLSMVYGFVKQSGGHLKIYSEPGEGTTVKIYLPRHHGEEIEVEEKVDLSSAPKSIYSENILVCEDDDDVRAYSVHSLRELGYRVVEAADGQSALRLLEDAAGSVDLLFTDIVLPGGMTGAMVADSARKIQPGLKVLFTTGYARDAIVHHGRLDPGVELLSKPFSYADLAARVREMLDARPGNRESLMDGAPGPTRTDTP